MCVVNRMGSVWGFNSWADATTVLWLNGIENKVSLCVYLITALDLLIYPSMQKCVSDFDTIIRETAKWKQQFRMI